MQKRNGVFYAVGAEMLKQGILLKIGQFPTGVYKERT
jgi:hypothetical protein